MRKLLISSTALASVAVLSAGVALADVSISGATEFKHISRDSNIAAHNGSFQQTDSEINIDFKNKTDNGLTVSWRAELEADADGTTTMDESSFSIEGGFGKVVLGSNDGVSDNYPIVSGDLIAEESGKGALGATTSMTMNYNSDIALGANDNVKISYHMPAMGGLTAGISLEDSGATATANAATDTTSLGAKYVMEVGGMAVTLSGASVTQETAAGTVDNDSSVAGIKVVSGNITAVYNAAVQKSDDENIDATGVAVSYAMSNGMTLGVYSDSAEDSEDSGESFKISGVELQYPVASGLTAVVNYDSYDYKRGTETSATNDAGSIVKLTIKAKF